MIIGYLFFFLSLLGFRPQREHLLRILLLFEILMFSCFLILFSNIGFSNIEIFSLFLVVSVCEATLGLSLLVLVSFTSGSEYTNLFNTFTC